MPEKASLIDQARAKLHTSLLRTVLTCDAGGFVSFADKSSKPSVEISKSIFNAIRGKKRISRKGAGQTSGAQFEKLIAQYLEDSFLKLGHLRPGHWEVLCNKTSISQFQQFLHLRDLLKLSEDNPELRSALGNGYLVKPDLVIARQPESDPDINRSQKIVGPKFAQLTGLRSSINSDTILHASVSCKWTIRSDRSQNSRTEALNLIRNRKGKLPHIVVVTAEPTPTRLASIALGTGDIDCVYHIALAELQDAVISVGSDDAKELLDILISGARLKDISDLPLDLAI